MQEFPYILSECEEINQVLHKPINSTQRIKYTCLNVSQNYIILGSTSGSIYLFNREPCTFRQLIPLSEGIVSNVSISPDEKIIALATTRGIICVVTLKPTIKLIATSNEHAYEKIMCLCWNDNSSEIYIGDGTGKVSAIVLTVFTMNGMFQSPSCTLMNLDSSIVQLNFSSPFLLISTLTRCYICDTVHEQYKQIGNKARNGEFGACFYKIQIDENVKTSTAVKKGQDIVKKKSSFSFISESNSNISESISPKIFCARPGSRFWEVSASGVVLKTHQFKELLAIPPMKIHKVTKQALEQRKYINHSWTSQSINFPQLFVIASKYLFSYTSNGLYILDLVNPNVILWSNEFTNITMVDVIENKIYLMISDNEFHCLTLYTLDALILHLYYTKQYYNCLETCITYKSQLSKLINDKYINDIYGIETNQRKLENDEISVLLQPLISILKSNLNSSPIKLDSGIVVVNSGNLKQKFNEDQQNKLTQQICSSSESIQISSIQNTPSDIKNILELNSNLSSTLDENLIKKIQIDLEPICTLSSSMKISMTEKEMEMFILDIRKKMDNIECLYKTLPQFKDLACDIIHIAKINFTKTFLTNVSIELLRSTMNMIITDHFIGAFILINTSNYKECTCGFPFPIDQIKEPSFLEIGKTLLQKLVNRSTERCIHLCNRVPYMWREYTTLYIKEQYAIEDILRQCLLTQDSVTLSIILPILDVNQWKLITMYLKKMNDKKCLSCEKLITLETNISSINWNRVIFEVMKRDGPDIAMVFFKKLEMLLPLESFDKSIFQSFIFSKILHHHGMQLAVDFKSNSNIYGYNTMCSTKIRDQLIKVLKRDIARFDNKNILSTGAHHWGMQYKSKNKSSTCPCCTLSLQTSVLLDNNGIAIFPCGHTYHVNCMIEKKLTKCNLH